MSIESPHGDGLTADQADEALHPALKRAGIAAWRSQPAPTHIPGAHLSPERNGQLQAEMRDINAAEMAVRGSTVIVYPNPVE